MTPTLATHVEQDIRPSRLELLALMKKMYVVPIGVLHRSLLDLETVSQRDTHEIYGPGKIEVKE